MRIGARSSGNRRVGVVLLVLSIGVVNLCLGYAAAAHLGYGPPGLV